MGEGRKWIVARVGNPHTLGQFEADTEDMALEQAWLFEAEWRSRWKPGLRAYDREMPVPPRDYLDGLVTRLKQNGVRLYAWPAGTTRPPEPR